MNKIIYTLSFLLFFSFSNNEAKAQSSDIDKCSLVSGAVNVTTLAAAIDKTCDTTGATKLSFQLHNLGFCTSAPNIKFQTNGKATDQRDSSVSNSYSEGTSDLSSCTFTIKQTNSTDEILESVGEVEPLPIDELPPKGTYTHAVIVFSNVVKVQGYTQFSTTIADTLSANGNSGTYCWTNGAAILEVGSFGPLITPPAGSQGLVNVGGGAKCGTTLAQAQTGQAENTITYKMNNLKTTDTTEAAQCRADAGCNTTRSAENTTLGTLNLFFTKVSSFTTPIINRATIDSDNKTSDANTITLVFGFNNPIVVSDETTGMDIKVNFDYALSVDFENVIPIGGTLKKNGVTDELEVGYTATKRIRLLGAGPFGIAFVPTQGGGVD
jgi:hypothetical protein